MLETFPLSCEQVCRLYPPTDEVMLGRILVAGCKADPDVTDETMLAAIQRAERDDQKTAALFETTVPEILSNWRKYPPQRGAAR